VRSPKGAPAAFTRCPRSAAHLVPPTPEGVRREPSPCVSPLRRHLPWRVLPRACARIGLTLPNAWHVPPSWFLTTSTACATMGLVGLLHPTADHGVHRVSTSRAPRARAASRRPHRCHTLQSFPLAGSRAHASASRCPLAVDRPGASLTSRPCSTDESVASATRCRIAEPVALLGFPFLESDAVVASSPIPEDGQGDHAAHTREACETHRRAIEITR
jgi:hypothetical protein